jgi:hypothetical protein
VIHDSCVHHQGGGGVAPLSSYGTLLDRRLACCRAHLGALSELEAIWDESLSSPGDDPAREAVLDLRPWLATDRAILERELLALHAQIQMLERGVRGGRSM